MSTYRRSGHYRTNKNGTRTWVSSHSVTRSSWNSGGSTYRYSTPAASYPAGLRPVVAPHEPPSLLVPNARCPLCGVSVYFYSNQDGSRVYFDELGPPWPKHHCTDALAHRPLQAHDFAVQRPRADRHRDPEAWRRRRAARVVGVEHGSEGWVIHVQQPASPKVTSFAWVDSTVEPPSLDAVVFEDTGRMSFVAETTLAPMTAPVRLVKRPLGVPRSRPAQGPTNLISIDAPGENSNGGNPITTTAVILVIVVLFSVLSG